MELKAIVLAVLLAGLFLLLRRATATVALRFSDAGRTREAVQYARLLLQRLPATRCRWDHVNVAINVFVNAGLYSEALRAPHRWPEHVLARAEERDPVSFALASINQAEALLNLGRPHDALALLDSVAAAAAGSEFARGGWSCLRAWILVHLGRIDEARAALRDTAIASISYRYAPEISYTHAALERAAGNFDAALNRARQGLDCAARASSVRNGLFLVADLAARLGDVRLAREKFQEAVDHPYKAQSADGLMRFAAFLEQLGETAGAARLRRLAARQDPESRLVAPRAS